MANDYIEIAMLATSAADPTTAKNIANVYQFHRIAGAGVPSKSEINTAFQAAIGATVLLAMNEDYAQTVNTVRFFDDALDLPMEFTQAGVGAVTGQRCPDYVTASIRLKSAIRSRSGRGRKSYSPISEASTTGDHLSVSGQALFDAVAAAILAGFTDASGNNWKPVIKSSMPPADYRHNPVVLNVNSVVSVTANANLGILKRRKVKI